MAEQEKQNLFREKVLEKISTPEQLSGYLRVTNPSVWIVLAAILLLLIGLFIWAVNATIETTVSTRVSFSDGIGIVEISALGGSAIGKGDTIRIGNRSLTIDTINVDKYGRVSAYVFSDMPDGTYNATIVIASDRPLDFLLKGR